MISPTSSRILAAVSRSADSGSNLFRGWSLDGLLVGAGLRSFAGSGRVGVHDDQGGDGLSRGLQLHGDWAA
jgi:hypothetical protein